MNKHPILLCVVSLLVFSTAHAQRVSKVDFAKKIKEATPPELPQSPVEKRAGTDARDKGLKDKVKSVVEYTQTAGSRKRDLSKESYYNERGNLIKTVHYEEGYPDIVTVFGFVDAMRVLRSEQISYAPGERPKSERFVIKTRAEDNSKSPNTPRDTRYQIRKFYKYDSQGRLIEDNAFQNNGELWYRIAYTYNGSRRIEREYNNDGHEMAKTAEFLDASGNIVEQHMYGADDTVSNKNIMKHEFDPQGNWIVEQTFGETTVKGKKTRKLLWTAYRTITYYP